MSTPKIPFFFSVDFEDFEHDYLRALGHPSPSMNIEALWRSYEKVNQLSDRHFAGRRVTFFVTGVVARAAPALVRTIAADGHEIACHYDFHDPISARPPGELGPSLDRAMDALASASGEVPTGFRAPNFAINPAHEWAFEELAKRFAYDSSYRTSSPLRELASDGYLRFGANQLREFFIYGAPYLRGRFSVRTGGTFMRLFPSRVTVGAMRDAVRKGHTALLYVHPYEILDDADFWVAWEKLRSAPSGGALAWARQLQWHRLGHRTFERKLADVCEHFQHQGPMRDAVEMHAV